MPSPLSNYPPSQRRLSTLSSPSSRPATLSVNSVLVPNSTNIDLSNPSSASSATTSFKVDWSSDGANPSSTNAAARRPEDIEMDSIAPTGHRRRRSTLTANPNIPQPSNSRTSRPRSTSIKSPGDLEAKISEEDQSRDASRSDDKSEGDLSEEDLHDDEETGLTKKDRRRKQAKRRRNTRLDQRIARDKITDEERKEADQNVVKKLVINAVLIGLWYLFSLSISLYNKWMFDAGQLNFAFPLFTTAMHMLVQFSLAGLVLYFIPSLRPGNSQHNSDAGRSRHEAEPERPIMTKMFYLTRIGPCGAATGLDIGLGNTSLKFITLTFYTMCKSSSLAFVLIFAFLFRLESPTWKLVAIIATMTAGVVMMVAGEVEFQLGGFVLVISAAFFSGFRWGLTQILLLRNPATSNPFSSIFFLAPVMFLTLMVIAVPVEGFFELIEGLKELGNEWGAVKTPLILLFPGTIAFLMTASEFALLQRSSVVTLSIAGIFKEVVTISAAALVFDDRLTPINISGLVVTISAIAAYNWIKLSKMRNDARMDVHNRTYQQAQSGSSSEVDRGSSSDEEETGLLAHDDESGAEDNLLTTDGDMIPNPRPSSSTEPHRTERSRED
ncbi:triose-phosphate transporter family-domain-containing protein [Hypoxylon trugodes]|uniref:triose-phosphate transporter family-domain-containing protein n=1 Tax=Hypoxylon trugodes TaxID=326681 RepID=UPI00219A65BF|nr:triose-phosphate transporter family-domain-containing protein [Hypoxylon trugodes]KAI1386575.1 triose-phosphate transporter family-domain-containing protein [Hypoxylon trugodes]